ncbi:hypothetical protein HH310_12735 [Actinoplanes sp. TBRC 11911]|uniref:hypothetical protein n=1 Tax=Actinoplanes sp. TBRC 11911 TaxID=2729386 RepID=UPI00145D2A4B|nr:hypothetical protein [Actinoplanes sp. TBRC 11911]NMO52060.1 hypothetical protein [Actinoplanes sp. TBRC 11911]
MTEPEDAMRMVEGPVVERADPFDPFDPEGGTVELARPGAPSPAAWPRDPLAPAGDLRGWLAGLAFVLRRCTLPMLPAAALAALPAHFFAGRVDDTVVAAPALSEAAGVFGLLLLPLMWLAYFAVAALPYVILLAGMAGVAVPAASGARSGLRTAWRLVAYRLRGLWLWLAAFGVVVQALGLLLTADRLGSAPAAQLAVALGIAAVASLTITGVLGCVVLIEGGPGLSRAAHLLSRRTAGPLVVASLGVLLLPRVGELIAGGPGSTIAAVGAILVWAAAAVVTYAQARFADRTAVSSSRLLGELEASGAA